MPNPNPPTAGFNENPQNINRDGRPKREWTVAGLIEQAMEQEDETGVPYKKAVYDKLVLLAKNGDIQAVKEINQRLDGMPKQTIDLGNKDDKPFYVELPRKMDTTSKTD